MEKNASKQNKGITLVALVITIVITLILAGTAISLITGEDGLFAKANHAASLYNQKSQSEADKLNQLMKYWNGNYASESDELYIEIYSTGDWVKQSSVDKNVTIYGRILGNIVKTKMIGPNGEISGFSINSNGTFEYKTTVSGTYTVEAENSLGKTASNSIELNIREDGTAPVISKILYQYINGKLIVKPIITDEDSGVNQSGILYAILDGEKTVNDFNGVEFTTNSEFNEKTEGEKYTIAVRAVDNAGNESEIAIEKIILNKIIERGQSYITINGAYITGTITSQNGYAYVYIDGKLSNSASSGSLNVLMYLEKGETISTRSDAGIYDLEIHEFEEDRTSITTKNVAKVTTQGGGYIFENDGYVTGTASKTGSSGAGIYLDGVAVFKADWQVSGDHNVSIYVKKGQKLTTRSSYGNYNLSVYEYTNDEVITGRNQSYTFTNDGYVTGTITSQNGYAYVYIDGKLSNSASSGSLNVLMYLEKGETITTKNDSGEYLLRIHEFSDEETNRTSKLIKQITTQGATYTFEDDGYVTGTASKTGSSGAGIYLDGVAVFKADWQVSGDHNVSIYVKKGQKLTTRSSYGNYNLSIYEFE